MTDLNRFGTINGSLKFELAPGPVAAFLQQYSINDVYVMNAMPDWAGVRAQPVGRIGAEGVIRRYDFYNR